MNKEEEQEAEKYLVEVTRKAELLFVSLMNKTVVFRKHCEQYGFYLTNEMIFQFMFEAVLKLMELGNEKEDY